MLRLMVDGGSSVSGELCTLWLVLGHAGTLPLAAAAAEQALAFIGDGNLRLSCSEAPQAHDGHPHVAAAAAEHVVPDV